MANNEMERLLERLKRAKKAAIFTHMRPDPDALGSQAAMAWLLEQFGAEEIYRMQFAEAPGPYKFLQEGVPGETAMWGSEWAGSSGGAIDTIVLVDTCTYGQLEPAMGFLKGERSEVVAVDHHVSREDVGPLIYADTKAAACVEILWEAGKAAGLRAEGKVAEAMMAGLVADTGWFRFDSVTARTHEMAAELTPHVNASAIYERMTQMEKKSKLTLMGRALASLTLNFGERFGCMVLRHRDFTETGAAQSQTEGLVDLPMAVQTVEVSALVTEMADGRVRASLRSKRAVDVNRVCNEFDGGGHAKAAGCRFDGPLDAAVAKLAAAVGRALGG